MPPRQSSNPNKRMAAVQAEEGTPARLRIVQWTSGIVGSASLRGILADPQLELVGLYTQSDSKIGADAGDIAGVGRVGIRATADIESVLELSPDCVVYMPQWPDVEVMETILRSGTNIVTTARLVTGSHYPQEAGARLESAALEGGVSLFGTGMNPMYLPTLALAATAMCHSVNHITITESVDCALYGAPATWAAYGFGKPLDPAALKNDLLSAEPDYREVLDVVAATLRVELDEHRLEVDYAVAREDRDLGYMHITAGTVSALDAHWVGLVSNQPFVELRTTWTLGGIFGFADDPPMPITYSHDVEITGTPGVRLRHSIVPGDATTFDVGISTAMPAVNAIPAVCRARAGIVTPIDLGIVSARGVVS